MKFKELKTRLKDKFLITISAGVLVFSLAITGVTCTAYAARNNGNHTKVETKANDIDTDKLVKDLMGDKNGVTEKNIGKEETVYLISSADGTVNKTIVSDHLLNKDEEKTLKDRSNLKDIENVKGDETFKESNGELTWDANGKDIYYQGTTKEEAPLTQKVTYKLDGKDIKPEDLAGKSGKVTIRFEYENNTSVDAKVNGKNVKVKVPFAAVNAVMLNEHFSNVEVTNGKLVENGSKSMVIGYAIPGLTESLGLKEDDLNGVKIPEYVEITADVENFELNVAMTVAVNAGNFLSTGNMSLDTVDDLLAKLNDASSQLKDGSSELAQGMSSLQEGLKKYTDGASKLNAGINTLYDKSGSLVNGASALNDGAQQLSSGLGDLSAGAAALDAGLEQLTTGTADLSKGTATLNGYSESIQALMVYGVEAICAQVNANADAAGILQALAAVKSDTSYATATKDNAAKICTALNDQQTQSALVQTIVTAQVQKQMVAQLMQAQGLTQEQAMAYLQTAEGKAKLSGAVQQQLADQATLAKVSGGIKTVGENLYKAAAGYQLASQLPSSLNTLNEGAKKVAAGTANAQAGASKISAGAATAQAGAQRLADGTQTLINSMPTLTGGIKALVNGSNELVSNNAALLSGADQLTAGSQKLAEGLTTFDQDGVKKIMEAYNGDISELVDRMQAVKDASESYGAFTDSADGVNTSVKFIYKLAEIKADK